MTLPTAAPGRSAALAAGIAPGACRSPVRRDGVIDREDLVKRLLDVEPRQTVTVSGPAGYGKTTSVLLWDEQDARRFAWLHLDALDDDPVHLVRHMALSVSGGEPLRPRHLRALTAPGRDTDRDMMPALLHLMTDGEPGVLVLDDVHLLSSNGARRILDGLLARVPAHWQLVLVGRSLPSVRLARHRLDRGVFEIGAADLAMTEHEAALLFSSAGVDLDDDDVAVVVERTEGWAGGLYLAALALARGGSAPQAFTGSDHLVTDYLVDEVLSTVAPDMVDFLERSAVLERMSAPLLDDLLEVHDAGKRLAAIERSGNLFLVPLDRQQDWYRYHHLLRDVLRKRLRTHDPERARELERRASVLLEARGDHDGAVRHAVAADDTRRAADLVLERTRELVHTGRVAQLGLWLDVLGPGAVERHPSAAIASAWFALTEGDVDTFRRALGAAERTDHEGRLADGTPTLTAALAVLRALAGWDGVTGVVRDAQVTRDAGPPETNPMWGVATLLQGTAYSMLGELDLARERFREGLLVATFPAEEAVALAHLALLAVYAGDHGEADRLSQRSVGILERHGLELVVQTIAVFPIAALVAARCGRPDDARRVAAATRRVIARMGLISPRSALLAHLLLAKSELATGDRALARASLEEAERVVRHEAGATFLNEQLDELRAQLAAGVDERAVDVPPITDAERRVLSYLPTHLSLQEIAEQLFVSRNTVKSHTIAIYRKLGVSSRTAAVQTARRLGMLAD